MALGLAALAALYGGATLGKDLLEGYWTRSAKREEMKAASKREMAKQEAVARLLREAKTSERRSIKELRKEKRSEKQEAREAELLRFFMQNRQNQLAMVLQAMQGINQPQVSPQIGGGGFLDVARSRL